MIISLNNLKANEEDFKKLYDEYYNYVYAICFRILENKNDIEDLLQEIFMAIFKTMERIQDLSSAKPWIATIAKNAAINRNKKIGTQNQMFVDIEDDLLYAYASDETPKDPLRIMVDSDNVKLIYQVIKELGPTYSHVLILKYKYFFEMDEIIKLLSLNKSTAYSKLERGRELLKKRLRQAQEEGGELGD